MLRITTNGARLKLEGRLSGPWVGELERLVGAHPKSERLTFDLSGVTFVSRPGAQLLRRLSLRAALTGMPPFVVELLGAGGDL